MSLAGRLEPADASARFGLSGAIVPSMMVVAVMSPPAMRIENDLTYGQENPMADCVVIPATISSRKELIHLKAFRWLARLELSARAAGRQIRLRQEPRIPVTVGGMPP